MISNKTMPKQTVVVAAEFSDGDCAALDYARVIAHSRNEKLVEVHSIDPVVYAFSGDVPGSVLADRASRGEFARFEEAARKHGMESHSKCDSNVIYQRIREAVQDSSASLLVLGTKARSAVGRAALGALARQLLIHCPCPILTVPAGAEARLSKAGLWGNVVVATDFSASSIAALRYAQDVVYGRLIVVHTVCCGKEASCSTCLGRLQYLSPFNESHTAPVEHFVAGGDPVAKISELVKRFRADLIVLGAPSIELSPREMESSTIVQIVSHAPCPVLIVPETDPTLAMEPCREIAAVS